MSSRGCSAILRTLFLDGVLCTIVPSGPAGLWAAAQVRVTPTASPSPWTALQEPGAVAKSLLTSALDCSQLEGTEPCPQQSLPTLCCSPRGHSEVAPPLFPSPPSLESHPLPGLSSTQLCANHIWTQKCGTLRQPLWNTWLESCPAQPTAQEGTAGSVLSPQSRCQIRVMGPEGTVGTGSSGAKAPVSYPGASSARQWADTGTGCQSPAPPHPLVLLHSKNSKTFLSKTYLFSPSHCVLLRFLSNTLSSKGSKKDQDSLCMCTNSPQYLYLLSMADKLTKEGWVCSGTRLANKIMLFHVANLRRGYQLMKDSNTEPASISSHSVCGQKGQFPLLGLQSFQTL